MKRLLSTADVVVENYPAGAFDELGLGCAEMSKANPRLIYCSISGFGRSGPKAAHTGYDNIFQATSGLAVQGTYGVHPGENKAECNR